MNVLVLITGTGRSGTSTMSGTLHHLGLDVPGPHLGANESNPKGFFESRWAVKFHNQLTSDAGIHIFDGRPGAFERSQAAITPATRAKLVSFLRRKSAEASQVVVKDPRSVWAQALWREAAAEAGLETCYITMLRHPAEVIGSRSTYYASRTDEVKRRHYETFNVARWINGSLISERETRGHPRAFVRYVELLEDWRPAVARIRDDLGLTLNTDLAPDEHHPVDDFIDAGLRRHQVTWDDLQVPAALREIAQQIWEDLDTLADSHGVDAAASADLDRQSERYAALLVESAGISHDATLEVVREAREAGAAEERDKWIAEQAAAPVPARGQLVDELGGRDLLKAAASRAARRIRRS